VVLRSVQSVLSVNLLTCMRCVNCISLSTLRMFLPYHSIGVQLYVNSVIKEFCFFFRISETAFLMVNCRYGNSNIILTETNTRFKDLTEEYTSL